MFLHQLMGGTEFYRVRTHGHFRALQKWCGSSGTELKIIMFCSFFHLPSKHWINFSLHILSHIIRGRPTAYSGQCTQPMQPPLLSTNFPVPTLQTTWPWLEIQHYYFLKKRYKVVNSQKLCALINTWNIPCPGGWQLKYVICDESSCFGRTHVPCQVISLWVVVQWDTFSGWNKSELRPEICCVWTSMCDLFSHTSSRAALRIGRGLL